MWIQIKSVSKGTFVVIALFACSVPAHAGNGATKAATSDEAAAEQIFENYYDIAIHRDLKNTQARDPGLTPRQKNKVMVDEYNREERELATLRDKLLKLDHAVVEKMLHTKMQDQSSDPDSPNAIYALEIVARALPDEFPDYEKLINAGSDLIRNANSIKWSYLGKNQPLTEHYDPDLK